MKKEVLVRYTIPTKFDIAPYGTISKVILDNDQQEFYIQISESEVQWLRLGTFFEEAFKGFFHDQDFVSECLLLFNKNTVDLFLDIKALEK